MKTIIANLIFAIILGTSLPVFTQTQPQPLDLNVHHFIRTNPFSARSCYDRATGLIKPCPVAFPKCLDVGGPIRSSGTPLVQFDCSSALSESFFLVETSAGTVQIQPESDRAKCIGIDLEPGPGSTVPRFANSALPLKLKSCVDNTGGSDVSTLWKIDKINSPTTIVAFMRTKEDNDACIDVPGGLTTPNLLLQIFTCNSGTNQRWTISR